MRIGQFSDTFLPIVDGVGRVVYSYANTLGRMSENVTVFAPKDNMGDVSHLPFRVQTYNTMAMPGRMPYRIGFPRLDAKYEQNLRHIALDIIHAHSPFMAGHAGLAAAREKGIPLVGSFHSKYYDDFSQVLKVDLLARGGVRLVVDFFEQCDEVWAVSQSTAQTLKEYGYTGDVVVMPNGTEIRTLDESLVPVMREQYALPPGVPVLLYVGQLNWKKNLRCTLEAVSELKRDGISFRLLIAGQGPHREEMEAETRALRIAAETTFVGHITDSAILDALYSIASLFVFPSLYDNAPMVLREAAVMSTPSVLVRGSNAAEGITDGENGLLCENSPASLAAAIRRGLNTPGLLEKLGDAARTTIPVSWETLMGQVLKRYQMLARYGTRKSHTR